MLTLANDPEKADRQMQAIIFYLTTFGYIDGDFDAAEKAFVRGYIGRLVRARVDAAMKTADAKLRDEIAGKYTQHFHEVFEGIDLQVKALFTESVAKDEDPQKFVEAKLKLRCFEIFKEFDRPGQEALMGSIDELMQADGQVHPAEVRFRGEFAALLEADLGVELEGELEAPAVRISGAVAKAPKRDNHPFFDQFEHHYSRDPVTIQRQIDADQKLGERVLEILGSQRAAGAGRLAGKKKVSDLAGSSPFLDGHVYVHPPQAGRSYELTVLGDLHGCYSCLKAAIMQAHFFEKVEAFKKDPAKNPEPKLVLLGDYIDRGLFSLNGVLRTVLQVFATVPEHVHVLRGNHEYYVEFNGQIYGGVRPAEAINTLKPHLPIEVFRRYMRLFDELPNVLLFDKLMFVHAGIPRDRLLKERWKDLSSLNDPDMRFQMMWSDPSSADVIPAELQEQSARFPFGRLQAAAFLQRMGCHTLIRGHEKVDAGFHETYHDDNVTLITLFSAGGKDNEDLPPDSGYRSVTPMALTVSWKDGEVEMTPWKIDYPAYNDPSRNAFFKLPPEIEHRLD